MGDELLCKQSGSYLVLAMVPFNAGPHCHHSFPLDSNDTWPSKEHSMVKSKGIPDSYTTRWGLNSSQSPIRTSNDFRSLGQSGTQRKYRSSCNKCRNARVKCSGGNPCQRCITTSTPSLCVYALSQRRGRLRAVDQEQEHGDFGPMTSSYPDSVGFDAPLELLCSQSDIGDYLLFNSSQALSFDNNSPTGVAVCSSTHAFHDAHC
jgi:hypothetical protein